MMDCYMKRYGAPTIIYDSFNRSNGYLGNADSGQAWSMSSFDTWSVYLNRALRTATGVSTYSMAYINSGRTNVVVSADITISDYSQGSHLVARMSGSNFDNCMSLYLHPSGNVAVRKRISGVDTFLGTTTFSYVSGTTYACRFECNGNDFKVYIDGVLKVSVTDDNALKTNTSVGMSLTVLTSTLNDYFDNFSVKG